MRQSFFILLFFLIDGLFSQNYSYQDYLADQKTVRKIYRHNHNNNIDSLKLDLAGYKNRLGFTYYQCKALIANADSDPNQMKYLDSAFMRGMTPLCIDVHLKKFDTTKVSESFKKNYLRAYNIRLVNLVDSIHYKDQQYRQQMTYWYDQPDENPSSKKSADGSKSINIKTQTKKEALDSLWKLQSKTDSSNMVKLNEIIEKYGWPGAKKVGDYYCKRPGPDVTMLFIHLGNTRREYQISTLKQVIELCEKQEDSWQNASGLIFGLHSKFSREFSEFSFLEIKNNQINKTKSFFSVYSMAEMRINSPTKAKIIIKCAKKALYDDLTTFMISMNDLVPSYPHEVPNKLTENSFELIESPELAENIIQYKFAKE